MIRANPAFVIHNNMIVFLQIELVQTSSISSQISDLFDFSSADGSWGIYLATKNLKFIFAKVRKIIVLEMNDALAISQHEACEFLFK
jgi:hypothetical protein